MNKWMTFAGESKEKKNQPEFFHEENYVLTQILAKQNSDYHSGWICAQKNHIHWPATDTQLNHQLSYFYEKILKNRHCAKRPAVTFSLCVINTFDICSARKELGLENNARRRWPGVIWRRAQAATSINISKQVNKALLFCFHPMPPFNQGNWVRACLRQLHLMYLIWLIHVKRNESVFHAGCRMNNWNLHKISFILDHLDCKLLLFITVGSPFLFYSASFYFSLAS